METKTGGYNRLLMVMIMNKAREYIKNGQVEILTVLQNIIIVKVGKYTCTRKKMRGYSIDTCGCQHHARHGTQGGRCAHKDAMVAYLVMSGI